MYYFLTNDINNPRLEYIINSIEKYYNVKVIILNNEGINQVNNYGIEIKSISKKKLNPNIFIIFRFVFFISKIAKSNFDKYFYNRNVYSLQLLRPFVNFFWKIKFFINKYLPIYNDVLFKLFKEIPVKISDHKIKSNDVFFIDSLLFRNADLIGEIKWLSKNSTLISVVMSFDNPIYSQITVRCSEILVWSNEMKNQLLHFHPYLSNEKVKINPVGSILFNPIVNKINQINLNNDYKDNYNNVGYGCMFCDEYMLKYELELIIYISNILSKQKMNLLVRPYPSLEINLYEKLFSVSNINIMRSSEKVNIRNSRDGNLYDEVLDSKIHFLKRCNWFLSLGTSLTIEAAICNLNILQIYLNTDAKFWKEINKRNLMNDHIKLYFSHFGIFDEQTNFCNNNHVNLQRDCKILLNKIGIDES